MGCNMGAAVEQNSSKITVVDGFAIPVNTVIAVELYMLTQPSFKASAIVYWLNGDNERFLLPVTEKLHANELSRFLEDRDSVAMRVVDRLIQRNRKLGRIAYENGEWTTRALSTAGVDHDAIARLVLSEIRAIAG